MRPSRRLPAPALAFSLVLVPLVGCAFNPPTVPPPPPIDIPLNDSPQNTMTRFKMTYEYQLQPEYVGLLTTDFRYTFSNESDPALAAKYGPNWGKDAEAESASNLFDGFTSSTTGAFLPGASNIAMTLHAVQYFDDPAHADSAAWYKWVVVSRVEMTIEIPGTPDPQIYNIDARHEFYLVRGDAALLDPGQEARADRWYIRRWDDLSTNPVPTTIAGGPPVGPDGDRSWGAFKDSFVR